MSITYQNTGSGYAISRDGEVVCLVSTYERAVAKATQLGRAEGREVREVRPAPEPPREDAPPSSATSDPAEPVGRLQAPVPATGDLLDEVIAASGPGFGAKVDAAVERLSLLDLPIPALRAALATGDHDGHLDALLAAERAGKTREGAVRALLARAASLR